MYLRKVFYIVHTHIYIIFYFFKLYLFYNDYETGYTIYTIGNDVCVRLLFVLNETGEPKPTCLTRRPHGHLTCRRLKRQKLDRGVSK